MTKPLQGRCLLLPALIVAACGGTDPGHDWQGVMRDSAGITIVENPGQGLWTPDRAWVVTEEWVIGHGVVEPEFEFGAISGLAASTSGLVVAFDRITTEVRVFDETGTPVHRFGRMGGGPGEFGGSAPYRVAIDAGDTLYVPDAVNQRVHRFLPSGDVLDPIPYAGGGGAFGVVALAPRTLLFHDFLASAGESLRLARGDRSEAETIVLMQPRVAPDPDAPVNPFPVRPVWTVLDDGRIAVGHTSAYRISIHAADGTVERILTGPVGRVPVRVEDHEPMRAMFSEMFIMSGADSATAARFLERIQLEMPDSLPAFTAFVPGPDGTLLVQRPAPVDAMDPRVWGGLAYEYGGGSTWDAFDREGRYLGGVEMPAGIRLVTRDGDHLYAVLTGAMDEDGIVRLRIARGPLSAGGK